MPFNPGAYIRAVVETLADAVAGALEDGTLAKDAAKTFLTTVEVLAASVVATGGASLPAALAGIPIAAAAASAALAAVVGTAAARTFGRRIVVTLERFPPLRRR